MLKLWEHYVNVFRKLVVEGFIIVKRKGSCLYYWVYPNTQIPCKFKIREAHEILDCANRSSDSFGSTTSFNYPCCVTREPLREWN